MLGAWHPLVAETMRQNNRSNNEGDRNHYSGITYLSIPKSFSSVRFIHKIYECLAIELGESLRIKYHMRKEPRIAKEISCPVPKIPIVQIEISYRTIVWYRDYIFSKLNLRLSEAEHQKERKKTTPVMRWEAVSHLSRMSLWV